LRDIPAKSWHLARLGTLPPMSWQPHTVGSRASLRHTFTNADVAAYAELTGDRNPLHFEASFASRTRAGGLIIHGGLTTGMFNAIVAEQLPGPGSVFLHQEWDYPAAVHIGDTVTAEVEVLSAREDKPITRLRCEARLDDGTVVLRGESVVYTMLPVDEATSGG
jgi:acyl dehydratase